MWLFISAVSPGDYGNLPAYTIGDGSGSNMIVQNLAIEDDDILEYDEDFTISIPDLPECTLGTPSSLTVTITDDDGMCWL